MQNKELYKHFTNSLGHVDEKKLFDVLNPCKRTKRVKSGVKSDAQTNKLCNFRNIDERLIEQTVRRIESIKDIDVKVYNCAILMMSGGLRVSEALSITPYNITSTGHIFIGGSKGSSNKLIDSGITKDYMLKCKNKKVEPFADINRFYVYRVFKRVGISYDSKNSDKKAVTHALRHLYVENLRKSGIEESDIKNFVGHKNITNTKKYGKRY